MSRIGKKPVAVPAGVTVTIEGQSVKVKGPKGELETQLVDLVEVKTGRRMRSRYRQLMRARQRVRPGVCRGRWWPTW